MTTINEASPAFYKVEIRAEGNRIGDTLATCDHTAARDMFDHLRAVYPQSKLMMRLDDVWFEATDEEMARSASINAALALAGILQQRVARVTWMLNNFEPGSLKGSADTREQVQEYAALLRCKVTEQVHGDTVWFSASGAYDGVPVRVSCSVKVEQPAEVSS
jgi:hypothetical protein